ncbi:hypothetical protein F5146DRAFT_1167910 [Armillaria mellea]|nr:hypothetical protein F5146DRAFT_1167910 [Armillaria mellea]
MLPDGAHIPTKRLPEALKYRINQRSRSVSELEKLDQSLQQLSAMVRCARNDLQPVNRLPTEILSLILKETRLDIPSFLPDLGPAMSLCRRHNQGWIALLHVCQRWRDTVRSLSPTWYITDDDLVEFTFLDKIGTSSLFSVILGFYRRDFPLYVIERLSGPSHRLREFHILVSYWQKLPVSTVFQVLSSAAPNLMSLSFECQNQYGTGGSHLMPLFDGQTPSLKMLHLDGFSTWPAHYFHGLTHVSFCRQSADLSQRQSTSEFLDFLEGCPLLEHLILFDAGPMRWFNSDVGELCNDRRVHLENLRTFQWGYFKPATVPHITRLISHLILSQTAVYLWGVEYWSPDESCDISNLVSAFGVGVTKVTEWRFSFTKTNGERNSEYNVTLVDGLLYTSVITYGPQINRIAVLDQVRDIQILCIDTSTRPRRPWTHIAWKTLFRCLPSVAELRLRNTSADLLRALYPEDNMGIVCPLLGAVSIEGGPAASDIHHSYVNDLAERRSLRMSLPKAED